MLGVMDVFGITDVGRVRDRNEDQFLIADLVKSVVIHHTSLSYYDETELHGSSQGKLLLVADGIGGKAAGERASMLAVEGIVQYLLNMMHWLFRVEHDREDLFIDDLKSALAWSQAKIRHAADVVPEHAGMGTTITMAYVIWPYAYLVHVGDSRAYLHRKSRLMQLTDDQTVAQGLADAGVLEKDQLKNHPLSHVLSSLLGCNSEELQPLTFKVKLHMGDSLMLCTDGLTRHLSNSDIADLVALDLSSESICRQLVASCNDAGGTDNTTIVLARFDAKPFDGSRVESNSALRVPIPTNIIPNSI